MDRPLEQTRSQDIDLVKGGMVFIMILHHSASVSHGSDIISFAKELTTILSFTHTAFILISGYLIGWYYLPMSTKAPAKTRRRLFTRAVKLLLLLTASNLILYLSGMNNTYELKEGTYNFQIVMDDILLLRQRHGISVSFKVLYPISIVLLIGSLTIGRVKGEHVLLGGLLLFILAPLSITMKILIGILGLWAGELALSGSFSFYIALINRTRGLPFMAFLPIYVYHLQGTVINVLLLILETILWFTCITSLIKLLNNKQLFNIFALYGRYTLLGYLGQVFILKVCFSVFSRMQLGGIEVYILNIVSTCLILYISLRLLDSSRRRHVIVDKAYRTVLA